MIKSRAIRYKSQHSSKPCSLAKMLLDTLKNIFMEDIKKNQPGGLNPGAELKTKETESIVGSGITKSSDSDSKPNTLSTKDYLTIAISILALVVSASTFFFTNYRIDNYLVAKIISFDWASDTIVIKVAYANLGNRQAIALNPSYQLAKTFTADEGSEGGEVRSSDVASIILQPHEMKIDDLKISMEKIGNFLSNSGDTIKGKAFCKIQFSGLDSKMERHDAETDFEIEINTAGRVINSVLPSNHKANNSYQLVEVFSN
jgi:hypothetical protein